MSRIISRASFARLVGVSRTAITSAVKQERLPSVDGNIDLDDPAIQAYVEEHKAMVQPEGGRGRPIVGGALPAVEEPPEAHVPADIVDDEPAPAPKKAANAADQSKQLDNSLKALKVARNKLMYLSDIKVLCSMEMASRSISHLKAVFEENVRRFDEQHGQELFELAQHASDSRTWSAELGKRLDKMMEIVTGALDREVESYRAEGPSA